MSCITFIFICFLDGASNMLLRNYYYLIFPGLITGSVAGSNNPDPLVKGIPKFPSQSFIYQSTQLFNFL